VWAAREGAAACSDVEGGWARSRSEEAGGEAPEAEEPRACEDELAAMYDMESGSALVTEVGI
jgi:hypothetical protein